VKKIAKDAIENAENDEDENELAIVMKNPHILNDIDFRAFAETLEAQGNVKKYSKTYE